MGFFRKTLSTGGDCWGMAQRQDIDIFQDVIGKSLDFMKSGPMVP